MGMINVNYLYTTQKQNLCMFYKNKYLPVAPLNILIFLVLLTLDLDKKFYINTLTNGARVL